MGAGGTEVAQGQAAASLHQKYAETVAAASGSGHEGGEQAQEFELYVPHWIQIKFYDHQV